MPLGIRPASIAESIAGKRDFTVSASGLPDASNMANGALPPVTWQALQCWARMGATWASRNTPVAAGDAVAAGVGLVLGAGEAALGVGAGEGLTVMLAGTAASSVGKAMGAAGGDGSMAGGGAPVQAARAEAPAIASRAPVTRARARWLGMVNPRLVCAERTDAHGRMKRPLDRSGPSLPGQPDETVVHKAREDSAGAIA
ncbi:hypothetical protein D3C72_539940 [compost metagenome]